MDLNIFKKTESNQKSISSVESFNIWNLLRVRYISIEKHQLYLNLVHDMDLSSFLSNHNKEFKKEVSYLEAEAKKYQIKAPPKPATEFKFTVQIDNITDKMIFRQILSDLMFELSGLKRATVSSTTTDNLRSNLIKFTMNHLYMYENFYKYGKLKGWTPVAPAYKVKPDGKEALSVSEANHIWDHINMRYDQKQLTDIFLDFVHDTDLQLIFKRGNTILEEQIKLLEQKAVEYEVPLPERPPAVTESPIDPEIMEDKFVYRVILANIGSAINLHIRAVIETIRNDSLREVFFKFLKSELDVYNNLLKYGKLKGWNHVVPMYRVSH